MQPQARLPAVSRRGRVGVATRCPWDPKLGCPVKGRLLLTLLRFLVCQTWQGGRDEGAGRPDGQSW